MTAAAVTAAERLFARHAGDLARLSHQMAERFARGGRLIAFATGDVAWSDARHVAVEFVHPVIVGKRALPAMAVSPEQVALLAGPDDIVMGFGATRSAVIPPECLVVWLQDLVDVDDPFVAQELCETLYHVLWEHVHVFFEHRGLLSGRRASAVHDAGASAFLYPFLDESETDLDAVLADVEASMLIKADEIAGLRAQTLADGADTLAAAAAALRALLDAGGTVLAFGNGGSATDSMDAVADLIAPPHGWPSRRAVDLTADSSILTAIANDIGTEALFARQVIAYGEAGDAAIAFSTSGNSVNIVAGLVEARRRGLLTVAFVGYDGGRIGSDGLADHVVITRSEYIPRIQEAQATAWHVLRGLIESSRPGPVG